MRVCLISWFNLTYLVSLYDEVIALKTGLIGCPFLSFYEQFEGRWFGIRVILQMYLGRGYTVIIKEMIYFSIVILRVICSFY